MRTGARGPRLSSLAARLALRCQARRPSRHIGAITLDSYSSPLTLVPGCAHDGALNTAEGDEMNIYRVTYPTATGEDQIEIHKDIDDIRARRWAARLTGLPVD